jgi:hypothetical protein
MSYGCIINLGSISSKYLNLMAFLTLVDSICRHYIAMVSVALTPAKWAHQITTNSIGLHYLFEAPNQLIFFQSNRITAFNINLKGI